MIKAILQIEKDLQQGFDSLLALSHLSESFKNQIKWLKKRI